MTASSQTCPAAAHYFFRIERLEYALQVAGRYPFSGVRYGQNDIVPLPDLIVSGNGFIQILIHGFNGYYAALRHCFSGIGHQIYQ